MDSSQCTIQLGYRICLSVYGSLLLIYMQIRDYLQIFKIQRVIRTLVTSTLDDLEEFTSKSLQEFIIGTTE